MEEVSSVGPSIRFFQLHVNKDRNVVAHQVRRAERAGFKAIVLTVDPPRTGRREKKQQEQVSTWSCFTANVFICGNWAIQVF